MLTKKKLKLYISFFHSIMLFLLKNIQNQNLPLETQNELWLNYLIYQHSLFLFIKYQKT